MKKTLENYTINDIESMTEETAFIYADDTAIIKEHDIYFVDFGVYFGFSALVFYAGKHIYYANDYQLHHKKYTWNEDGTHTTEDYTKEELKALYIETLNNKLFTDKELSEPLKSYDEYQKKNYFLRNYYGMRQEYISMFFIGTDEEWANIQKLTSKMYFSPITFSYYCNPEFPEKIERLHKALEKQKADTVNNYEYQKDAFKKEMFNHEYSINWQADYDTLSAFGRLSYKSNATLTDYFNQLHFNDIQRNAYTAARREYYKECNY